MLIKQAIFFSLICCLVINSNEDPRSTVIAQLQQKDDMKQIAPHKKYRPNICHEIVQDCCKVTGKCCVPALACLYICLINICGCGDRDED